MESKMIKSALMIAAVACVVPMAAGYAQDLNAGATSFKKCAACHDVGETAKNKVGPVLNGLEGRKTGTVAGYNYSEANKNSGIVWSEASFVDYIKDPKAKIPSTKMVFAGIKNENEAKNLWAYLVQFAPDGKKK
jgi:cytochrome c